MAITSYADDMKYLTAVLGGNLLGDSIDWINKEMVPEDVFDEKKLMEWAQANCSVEEVALIGELETWAKDNGYVKAPPMKKPDREEEQ